MKAKIFMCKNDAKTFVSRNIFKIIVCIAVTVLGVIFALRKVTILESINDYFESKGSPLFSIVKGTGSLLTFTIILILENAIYLLLMYLCLYNNFTTYLFYLLLWNRVYRSVIKAVVIIAYFGVKALPFFILYLLSVLLILTIYSAHFVTINSSGTRLKYGTNELCRSLGNYVYFYLFYIIAIIITVIFVSIGSAFIV